MRDALLLALQEFEGAVVLVDGKPVFRVLADDVDQEAAETADLVATEAARNLQQALDEIAATMPQRREKARAAHEREVARIRAAAPG